MRPNEKTVGEAGGGQARCGIVSLHVDRLFADEAEVPLRLVQFLFEFVPIADREPIEK
jgi:hypothetical protein